MKNLRFLVTPLVLLFLLYSLVMPAGVVAGAPHPTFTGMNPDSASQGEWIFVNILPTSGWGDDYELQDSTLGVHCVDLGPGITLGAYGTHYPPGSCLRMSIHIDAGAALGSRNCVLHVQNAAGTDKFDLTLPNAFTVTSAGPTPTKVQVETAADGSGTVVPAQSIPIGSAITAYAITRDASDVFIANVAADTWSLQSKTGGVVDGDLIPSGDNKSAVFTGHAAGTAQVRATSGALVTTNSGTLTVAVIPPPTVTAVNPNTGNPGQTLNVIITGTNFTGTTVSFGAGITVNNFTVNSATQITANITIAADATLDTGDVSVTTEGGTGTLPNGFTVTAQAAPRAPTKPKPKPFAESPQMPGQLISSPANLSVKYLNVQPQQAQANQPVTIYANIANSGDEGGGYNATLKINGNVEAVKSGNIGGNIAKPLQFTVYRDTPGNYEVDLNGQKTFFTVVGPAQNSPVDWRYIILAILGVSVMVIAIALIRRLAYR